MVSATFGVYLKNLQGGVKVTNENQNHNCEVKFKDVIVKEFGEIPISNTQKYRVLLVMDENSNKKISAQKWWRPSSDEDWRVGKGFKLTAKEALLLSKLLEDSGNSLLNPN